MNNVFVNIKKTLTVCTVNVLKKAGLKHLINDNIVLFVT